MNFKPQEIAEQIHLYTKVAGVTQVTMCMTRLRINVTNSSLLEIDKIKAINGVLGVLDTQGQVQIIIGPGKVNQVYEHFMQLIANFRLAQLAIPHLQNNIQVHKSLPELGKQARLSPFKALLKKLTNIFIPLIPAFIGCGLILGIVNILAKIIYPEILGGITFDKSTLGAVLKLIGGSITFGLTLFVGINSAKEFGGTPILGGALAALISMPELANITVFNVPAIPGRGGVIAVLLVSFFAAHLEQRFRKIIPVALDLFLTPTLVLLISGFLAIFILQPVGGIFSDWLSAGSKLAIEHGGPLMGFILSAAFLPLVMTGLHQGLIPIHAELIKTTGVTILLPILAMAGAGQVGAALAVCLKTKNSRLRHIIKSSIVVGFLGIGEPLIYGVTLPLVKPFIGACIGGGLGGAFVANFELGATGIGISGLPLTLLIQHDMLLYLAGIGLAYLGGFIATLIIGFDDSIFNN